MPSDGLPFPEPAGGGLPAAQHQVQVALDQVTQPASSGVIRGVSMAVVTMNWSWAGVTGTDGDNVPLVPEAMADIASITKTVTAAEIMFLAQAGQIDLDTPATTCLAHPCCTGIPLCGNCSPTPAAFRNTPPNRFSPRCSPILHEHGLPWRPRPLPPDRCPTRATR